MKNFNKKMIIVLTLFPAMSMSAPFSYEATVPVDHVFVPAGFDSNDNTEIVVTGFLPNLCYKIPKSIIAVKDKKISVSIKATKNVTALGLNYCANVIVPYTESIKMGLLNQGKFQIVVNEESSWEKKNSISIAEAKNSSVDDVVYANVEEIVRPEDGSRKIKLKGFNPSDCFELKEIVIIDNGVDTYSVLPKMKQTKDICPQKSVPFIYEFEVPGKLEADRILLHVRVMAGRSINAFFNNNPLRE